ncbi:MAG TPA: ATP-binding cassette domain-containing protein [Syntrophorhabdaceae bacterium]|nr:ATP-binding cassette domain-containing protein [Syntrophorhabdaceae bacterium]
MGPRNIIEIKNAHVYRGETKVFNRFSLEIRARQSVAVIGPNGAGKTTLLKLLTRELYPLNQKGSYVRILGETLWNVWELRAHLGIVSSDLQEHYIGDAQGINVLLSGLYSSVDIWSHQRFTRADMKRAEETLQLLEVPHCRNKRFSDMSTGEQRRLLLGRALIHDPDVLVLDEPTSGLDVKACFQYMEIVRNLMRAGKTVVLVTHHIHEIPPEITRIILLKTGKVMADGEKSRVLTSRNLTKLFGIPVELIRVDGLYQIMPAAK